MSQIRSGSQAVAAALVGSLASFSLVDILDLLARTERTGELQVVGHDVDRRIWIDRGDLLDTTGSDPEGVALFELACIVDGWFYFTAATTAPEATGRIPVATVLGDLGPQVAEWHGLVAELPFTSVVRMSSSTPAAEVQIRSDQWQLLSLVGAGRTVREVVDTAPLHPLDVLRTLRELGAAMLITVEEPEPPSTGPGTVPPPPAASEGDGTQAGDVDQGSVPAAEPVAEPVAPGGAGGTAASGEEEGQAKGPEFATNLPLPPFSAPPPPPPPAVPPIPSAPPGPPPRSATTVPPPPAVPRPQRTVMPPPISGDPWSVPPPEPRSDEPPT